VVSAAMTEQEVHSSVAQRIIIKFLSNEGVKSSEVFTRLKVQFGDTALSQNRVYTWAREIKGGRERVENESHCQRPRSSVIEDFISAIREVIEADRRLAIPEISTEIGISYESVQSVITDNLGFRKRHDNARPRTALSTRDTLEEMRRKTLEHPPYSPDLSPCDYFLFAPFKESLGGKRFESNEGVEKHVAQLVYN